MALKIGIVGMGGIGKLHAKCYNENPLANLVAVCDVIEKKATDAGTELGVPAYTSLSDMLAAHPELDIVDVTTSGFENGSWHYEPVMQAIAAGKHVLVEKPISNDILEAREMVRYAAEKDVYLGCNLNHYFTKTSDRAMQYIRDGQIGEPVYLMQKMGFDGSDHLYGGAPAHNSRWQRPYAHAKAFLAHPFSVLRYFGGNITHVQAFFDRPGVRATADDLMWSINSVHVKFENGSIGYLISQRGDANFGLGGWWSMEMAGTRGTFCIENCVEKLTFWEGAKKGEEKPAPVVLDTGITDFNSTFPTRLNAFLEDVTNGVAKQDLRASGRDALATLEYTFAAIQSFEEGGAVVRPHALPNLHGTPGIIF